MLVSISPLVLEGDDAGLEHAKARLHGEDDEAGGQDPGGVVPLPDGAAVNLLVKWCGIVPCQVQKLTIW